MFTRSVTILALAAALVAGSEHPGAAQHQITNARLETVAMSRSLAREIEALAGRTAEPFWIGYVEPVVDGERVLCCHSSGTVSDTVVVSSGAEACCPGCRLEPGARGPAAPAASGRPVPLEGVVEFVVLARVERGDVTKIRLFSSDCPVDAGSRTVYWLTGVAPAVSVDWLTTFAAAGDVLARAAVAAIALHGDEAADRALDRLVGADQPPKVRESAAFWMGQARGRRGFETLRRLVTEDPDERFRNRVIFAIARSEQPETIDVLLDLARHGQSPNARGEALFWLAQNAGARATASLADAIASDPDTDVKKRAVFALTRLPSDEGVPMLIEIARTNKNPEVRRQAMFWLGQSKDPRALAFFEEILKK